MQKLKALLPFFLLILVALPIIIWLFPSADPYGALRLEKDYEGIMERSRVLLDSLMISHEQLRSDIELKVNKQLVRQTQEEFGLARSNELLRTSLPGYFWEVRWMTKDTPDLGGAGANDRREAERILEILRGQVRLELTGSGKLIGFDRKIPDSLALPSLNADEARMLAESVVRHYGDAVPEGIFSERVLPMPGRTDHEFVWRTSYQPLSNTVHLKVRVSGNILTRVETALNVPAVYAKAPFETGIQIIIVILSAIAIIALVVLAFRRFRSFELGFRLAFAVGIISALSVASEIYISSRETGWEMALALFFGALVVGGAILLIWAVCESVGRETWREKFVSLDLLTRGHAHSRVGASVIRGLALGIGALAFWLAMVSVIGVWIPVWISPSGENALRIFQVATPSILLLAHGFYTSVYVFALFVLFSVSALRRFFSSPVSLIAVAALILGVMRQGSLFPLPAGIVVHVLLGAVIVWSLYRYDVLAAFLAMFTMAVAQDVGALWMAGHTTYASAAIALFVAAGVLLLGSAAAQFRRKEITDFDTIAPAFARHITERQRLQQELEIARQVQMSFLPKSDPTMTGLDISSRCVPAQEVGGDYYDFVRLGPKLLSVAVGDVSGKGTQAAFYMTLAKGFLRALSNSSGSVSNVLIQINRLFYENVERGAFISMVYAVFDMKARKLRLTRAGHNPVLVWRAKKKKLEVIQPNGLALGLEEGKKFSKTIQEVKISFAQGDCFVFYTDGFTEAMNKDGEEYGDERFAVTVQNFAGGTAREMVEGIFGQVRVYIGKAKQHDDMTLVVVRVA